MLIDINAAEVVFEKEFFLSKYKKTLNFLPSELFEWATVSNIHIEYDDIKEWDAFESGKLDFSRKDFWILIFEGCGYSLDANVLIISDETLKQKSAFSFRLSDYDEFISLYEKTFGMNLFQPEDYIIYIKEYKHLKIIHHEGKLIKMSRPA